MDQQTSVSTPQANPNQPTKKSGNKLVKIGIIIIILLILLGVGYLIYTSYSTKPKETNSTTKSATQSATKTLKEEPKPAPIQKDEIADWKTFTNSSFKYSLKYPDTLNPFSNSPMGGDSAEVSGDVIFTDDPKVTTETRGVEGTIGKDFYLLEIYVIDKNGNSYYTGKTLTEIAQGDYNKNKTSAESITELTQTTFGGKSAYSFQKTKASAFDYLAGGWLLTQETIKIIEVENNGSIYYLIYRPNDTIEKIISTFKFI